MDRKAQMLALVATLGIFFGMMALAAWWSTSQQSGTSTQRTSRLRFRARPGTTRDNAMILTTKKRDPDDTSLSSGQGGETAEAKDKSAGPDSQHKPPELEVRSLSPVDGGAGSPVEKSIRSALNTLSPEAGIARLKLALDTPHTPEEDARMHTAMGMLYAQLDPPDYAGAKQAFEQAMRAAPNPAARREALKHYAAMALNAGRAETVLPVLESALRQTAEEPAGQAPLQLLLGQIHEAAGRLEPAEQAYQRVIDTALGNNGAPPKPVENAVRLAALRLSRLYTTSGRKEKAEALRERVAGRLGPESEGASR